VRPGLMAGAQVVASHSGRGVSITHIIVPPSNVGFTGSGGAGNTPMPTQMIAGKSRTDSRAA
ncbi:hypothetical protein D6779_11400, partial [Candidatus Parcubacteria bacterium]